VELIRGWSKAVEAEPALRVGRRGLRRDGHFHEHTVECLARARVDDRADDDAGRRLRVRQRANPSIRQSDNSLSKMRRARLKTVSIMRGVSLPVLVF
jgi:hypothetical protein